MADSVDHPKHYQHYSIEPIEVCRRLDFDRGNAIKYICRAPYKGNEIEDLEKASWYLRDLFNAPYVEPDPMAQTGLAALADEHCDFYCKRALEEIWKNNPFRAIQWLRKRIFELKFPGKEQPEY